MKNKYPRLAIGTSYLFDDMVRSFIRCREKKITRFKNELFINSGGYDRKLPKIYKIA